MLVIERKRESCWFEGKIANETDCAVCVCVYVWCVCLCLCVCVYVVFMFFCFCVYVCQYVYFCVCEYVCLHFFSTKKKENESMLLIANASDSETVLVKT